MQIVTNSAHSGIVRMDLRAIVPALLNPFGFNSISGTGYSPYGGPLPFGGFGAPYTIGVALPKGIAGYAASGKTALSYSLRAAGGGLVSVGSATDHAGASVLTATVNTSKGGI